MAKKERQRRKVISKPKSWILTQFREIVSDQTPNIPEEREDQLSNFARITPN